MFCKFMKNFRSIISERFSQCSPQSRGVSEKGENEGKKNTESYRSAGSTFEKRQGLVPREAHVQITRPRLEYLPSTNRAN